MNPRVWTAEELTQVWRLPEVDGKRIHYPWVWRVDDGNVPVAYEVGPSEPNEVWVDERGCLASGDGEPPIEVALAVIGAHQGRDSVETLAIDVAERSETARVAALETGNGSNAAIRRAARWEGIAVEARRCADMLRAGRVPA